MKPPNQKLCSHCGDAKPETDSFWYRYDGRHFRNICRECVKAKARTFMNAKYASNPEERLRVQEQNRKRVTANPELDRARSRAYYQANRERLRAEALVRGKRNYYADPEKRLAIIKIWQRANPLKRKAIGNRSIAKRRKATMTPVDYAALLNRHGMVCHLCGGLIQVGDLAFDHVIPIKRGGEHSEENLRPAHQLGNARKAARLVSDLPLILGENWREVICRPRI